MAVPCLVNGGTLQKQVADQDLYLFRFVKVELQVMVKLCFLSIP
jgi:hypothetical protein